MQRVAQAWLVLSLTHSPVAVGILALCQFLPFTLFSLSPASSSTGSTPRRTVIGTQVRQMFARLDDRRDRAHRCRAARGTST